MITELAKFVQFLQFGLHLTSYGRTINLLTKIAACSTVVASAAHSCETSGGKNWVGLFYFSLCEGSKSNLVKDRAKSSLLHQIPAVFLDY